MVCLFPAGLPPPRYHGRGPTAELMLRFFPPPVAGGGDFYDLEYNSTTNCSLATGVSSSRVG
ncbi:MAG: hypothetical protein EBZ07_06260, partial [Verrucomicrobia bacterium]|nr:hypothetical protein [Verrucomicrobiota bacterium]